MTVPVDEGKHVARCHIESTKVAGRNDSIRRIGDDMR